LSHNKEPKSAVLPILTNFVYTEEHKQTESTDKANSAKNIIEERNRSEDELKLYPRLDTTGSEEEHKT
jgi:hypothetical protein